MVGCMTRGSFSWSRTRGATRRPSHQPSTQESYPMHRDTMMQEARDLAHVYRITKGGTFRLQDIDPADTAGLEAEDKPRAQEGLQTGVQALAALQDRLYAQARWAVLLIFQGMDAAGKDSAIKHVMAGLNPQGCQV